MRTKSSKKKSLVDQAADLVEQATPHVEAARERVVNEYLPLAQSVLADAREAAREVAADAKEAAVEAEKATRKRRKKAKAQAKARARSIVDTAVEAAPAGMPMVDRAKSKPRRKKRMLLFLAVVGAGAIVIKRLREGATAGPSYTPPAPPPRPSSTPPAPPDTHFEPDPVAEAAAIDSEPAAGGDPLTDPVTDPVTDDVTDAGPGAEVPPADRGGSFFDEVLADADEHPHRVTTPDRPATTEDVSDVEDPKS
jgi:hypothetical protein